ncbi:hypothetical protein D3C71_1498870 [compost metagenome]
MNYKSRLLAFSLFLCAALANADEVQRACGDFDSNVMTTRAQCQRERTQDDREYCEATKLRRAQDTHAACLVRFNTRGAKSVQEARERSNRIRREP